jgi:hypothetical protein
VPEAEASSGSRISTMGFQVSGFRLYLPARTRLWKQAVAAIQSKLLKESMVELGMFSQAMLRGREYKAAHPTAVVASPVHSPRPTTLARGVSRPLTGGTSVSTGLD